MVLVPTGRMAQSSYSEAMGRGSNSRRKYRKKNMDVAPNPEKLTAKWQKDLQILRSLRS